MKPPSTFRVVVVVVLILFDVAVGGGGQWSVFGQASSLAFNTILHVYVCYE
jgi:hypothetical protein